MLPRITSVELRGYDPIFEEDIEASIKHNRLLILGGNGLGKTTTLQSIIYCIAGEADLYIEPEKSRRWGRKYFVERLDNPDKALVRVEFFLDRYKIKLARGFRNRKIREFWLDNELVADKNAQVDFEHFLVEEAGYRTADDFRYIVHKLCYLPEDRANLVWNSESQLRLLMLLFSDVVDEGKYRERREQLKKFDSKRRHINVHINNAEKQLETLYGYQDEPNELDTDWDNALDTERSLDKINGSDSTAILQEMNTLARKRVPLQKNMRELKRKISNLTREIEELQEQLEREQEAFILNQLKQFETDEAKLSIHKLLHRQICPACGSEAETLSKQAQNNVRAERCPLCGTDQVILNDNLLPLLDSQLSEKLRVKIALEKQLLEDDSRFEIIALQEEELQLIYDEIKLKSSIISKSYEMDEPEEANLQSELEHLKFEYEDISSDFERLRSDLQDEYKEFATITGDRVVLLGELYERYATDFLGMACELVKEAAGIKFLDLELFVPKFSGKIRSSPETCSEAQRFFLDIAFRMAMIDLAKKLSSTNGSFICETPENALDITYIDNVASMFKRFSREGHTLIATGNLQPSSLARPILQEDRKSVRRQSILNLVEYGNLSSVQQENLWDLQRELQAIVEGK